MERFFHAFRDSYESKQHRIRSCSATKFNILSSRTKLCTLPYPVFAFTSCLRRGEKRKRNETILPLTEKIIFEPFLLSPPDYREISSPRRKTKRRKIRQGVEERFSAARTSFQSPLCYRVMGQVCLRTLKTGRLVNFAEADTPRIFGISTDFGCLDIAFHGFPALHSETEACDSSV